MFKREDRYLVFKGRDMHGLSSTELEYLFYLQDRCTQLRKFRGKEPLVSVVIEKDWPEYEVVWKMLEVRCANAI